ncbi:hypothetical protein JXA47_01135 [Candidatus Sumerlaeota bacterium]|nr:hypothetical protein [Candidatus Sumerlaeota bacterium]
MMRLTILSIGLILIIRSLMAAPIELLVEDDGTFNAGTLGEFLQSPGNDSDPNCLDVLSNGSLVYFETQFDCVNGADSVVLFDEDAPGGGVNRFAVIASEAALQTAAGLATTENIGGVDIAVGDNDNVYLLGTNTTPATPEWYIWRIPSTGGNSFSAPEIAANPTALGASAGGDYSLGIDLSTDPDTLIIGIDDSVLANDTTTNGIYTLDASATNGTPTIISGGSGTATLAAVSTASGDVGGTDKGTCSDVVVIPGGNILVCNGTSGAGPTRGNIVEVDRVSGAVSLWLDAGLLGGTPIQASLAYNATSNRVGVFWFVGAVSGAPTTDDRIEEYTAAGVFDKIVASEPDIEAVQPSSPSTDLNIFSNAFATDGTNYYVFLGNNYEGLIRVPQVIPVELSVFSAD